MDLNEIQNLKIENCIYQVLARLGLIIPVTVNFDEEGNILWDSIPLQKKVVKDEFDRYKLFLQKEEEDRIIEVNHIKSMKESWNLMNKFDTGMPWFYSIYPNIANKEKFFEDLLQDKTNRDSILSAIQAKFNEYKTSYLENDYVEKREKEYPSTKELIVALWEKVVENKPESAATLQEKRELIKLKYPKK